MNKLWLAFRNPSFDNLKDCVNDLVYQGYPMATILSQIHDEIIQNNEISDLDKAFISEKLAEVGGGSHYMTVL
jgi:hypothetical protein